MSSVGRPGHEHGHTHDHAHGHTHPHSHDHAPGLRAHLKGLVGMHSHDAADSVDDVLESSAAGIRAVKVSLLGLGATALLQALVVAVSGSVALLADTVHNVADALTALPLWVAFVLGRRAPTRRFTYGFGRAEDLAGVLIVLVIAASAALAVVESLRRLADPEPLAHAPWVLLAGLVGFAGNELVAVYRMRVGRRLGSAALVADGHHARTDGLTSLAVVAGAAGSLAGFPLADPLAGLAISVAITVVLVGAARDVGHRLLDAVDPTLVDATETSLRTVHGVLALESVRLRWVGHRLRAEVALVADAGLDLVDAHAIATRAHHRLLHDVPRLDAATVHVSPADHDGHDHHEVLAHHRR